MTQRDRRERDFSAREKYFLAEAARQIRSEGLLSLQMAAMARACGYATGTLYQHFRSKEDLLLALSAEQTGERVALLRRAHAWQAGTRDRMVAMQIADLMFVLHHPDHFRLTQYIFTEVIWEAASEDRRQQVLLAHQPVFDLVAEIIDQARQQGDLPAGTPTAPLHAALGLLCLNVGFHNILHARGLTDLLRLEDPCRAFFRQLTLNLNAMHWSPIVGNDDDAYRDQVVERIIQTLFPEFPPPSQTPGLGPTCPGTAP